MLDLRLPVGIFFLLVGIVLTIDGFLQPVKVMGLNLVINLDWGIVLVVFGALMTIFGAMAQKRGITSGGADPSPDQTIDMTR